MADKSADEKMLEKLRVKPGRKKVRLRDWDPADTCGYDKKTAAELTQRSVERLAELQYLLYAENRRSLLVVLQARDAGGKDGVIRHVLGPINPQGVRVTPFKTPTAEELAHDFLWRIHRQCPAHGMIGVFNRSHYEDVLIVRVRNLVKKSLWSRRYRQINDFERLLTAGGTHIVKLFLNVSKEEQLARFRARLEDPTKHWKASPADFEERGYWDDYTAAYEDMLAKCSTKRAPWHVIPADNKWFRNLAVAQILVDTLSGLKMKFPEPAHDLSHIQLA